MWYSLTCVVSDVSNNARVAQWWSVSLPRRRSRVRSPSRALFFAQKWLLVLAINCSPLSHFFEQREVRSTSQTPYFIRGCSSPAPKVAVGRLDGKKVRRIFFYFRLTSVSRLFLCPKTVTFRYLKVGHWILDLVV